MRRRYCIFSLVSFWCYIFLHSFTLSPSLSFTPLLINPSSCSLTRSAKIKCASLKKSVIKNWVSLFMSLQTLRWCILYVNGRYEPYIGTNIIEGVHINQDFFPTTVILANFKSSALLSTGHGDCKLYQSYWPNSRKKNEVLLEKPIIHKPVKKFAAIPGSRRFITVLTKARQLPQFWTRLIQTKLCHFMI